MLQKIALAAVLAVFVSDVGYAQQAGKVESKGQQAKIKIEEPVAGYLTELNGRYKLRVTQISYEPGGYTGSHHHVGPGIRCITSGELTFTTDQTHVYRPGDCFFESGDVSHTARNATDKPTMLLNFELVTASHTGGTAIPVRK
jgi:quercetin dioxygenase-like cupin family protein